MNVMSSKAIGVIAFLLISTLAQETTIFLAEVT